jgi:hypothetical protein
MSRAILAVSAILSLTPAAFPGLAAGSESHAASGHADRDHHAHRNHVSVFLGGSTHLNNGDTAFTCGGHYARRLSPHWSVGVIGEYASSDIERDLIVLAGAGYRLTPVFVIIGGVGAEWAQREEEHHGHTETEKVTELLVRVGVGYQIPLGERWTLNPQFLGDWTQHTWTLVYGISLGYGF